MINTNSIGIACSIIKNIPECITDVQFTENMPKIINEGIELQSFGIIWSTGNFDSNDYPFMVSKATK